MKDFYTIVAQVLSLIRALTLDVQVFIAERRELQQEVESLRSEVKALRHEINALRRKSKTGFALRNPNRPGTL